MSSPFLFAPHTITISTLPGRNGSGGRNAISIHSKLLVAFGNRAASNIRKFAALGHRSFWRTVLIIGAALTRVTTAQSRLMHPIHSIAPAHSIANRCWGKPQHSFADPDAVNVVEDFYEATVSGSVGVLLKPEILIKIGVAIVGAWVCAIIAAAAGVPLLAVVVFALSVSAGVFRCPRLHHRPLW